MKKSLSAILILLTIPLLIAAQADTIDLEMLYRIKQQGQQKSQVQDMAFWLTDFIGPRLVGSTGNTRANEWAKKKLEEIGLQNVSIAEARSFTRGGWDNLKTYAAMTAPYYASFACNPVAWTGSTKGLVKGEVVLLDIKSEDELKKYKGKVQGKIVLVPSTATYDVSFDPLARRYTDERLRSMTLESAPAAATPRPPADIIAMSSQMRLNTVISEFLKNEGAAVVLRSSGSFNVPRSTGAAYRSGDKEPVAELNLPLEAHGRMERLIRHKVPVEMEVEIMNRFFPSPKIFNVLGDIPGTDLKDEVVMLGAHIDSWHGGTGAADNASGCVVMMEAVRILKDLGVAPRRTIRIALWGGEEQGLHGSRGYVEQYLSDASASRKPEWEKFSAYFNMDNGTGRYRGIYLQQNDMVRPIFEKWMEPLQSLGFTTIAPRNTGGTDHLAFDAAGLPGFQFIQDEIEYSRGYHTVMDTYERLIMADLRVNAVITAWFVYNAAMRDEKLPRKPR